MAIYMYLVVSFLGDPTADFETFIPILVASDHAAFIGVITNLVFALALTLAADRRSIWPWADQVVYWLMNVGLVVFADRARRGGRPSSSASGRRSWASASCSALP